MGCGAVFLKGSSGENSGFGGALVFGVIVFEREEEGLVRIAGEGPYILAGGEGTVIADETVVDFIEELAGFRNLLLRRVLKLSSKHEPHGIAHVHHIPYTRCG